MIKLLSNKFRRGNKQGKVTETSLLCALFTIYKVHQIITATFLHSRKIKLLYKKIIGKCIFRGRDRKIADSKSETEVPAQDPEISN